MSFVPSKGIGIYKLDLAQKKKNTSIMSKFSFNCHMPYKTIKFVQKFITFSYGYDSYMIFYLIASFSNCSSLMTSLSLFTSCTNDLIPSSLTLRCFFLSLMLSIKAFMPSSDLNSWSCAVISVIFTLN